MKELSLDEIKAIELDILKWIDRFCKENKVQYFLDSGTLLGAVRHKGFIPWDDDIDIIMLREDYERFLKLMKNEKEYKLINYKNSDNYLYVFSKVYDDNTIICEQEETIVKPDYGIYVDIFPIDKLPDNKLLCRLFQFLILMRKRQIWAVTMPPVRSKFIFKLIYLFSLRKKNFRYYLGKLDKFIQKYNKKDTKVIWGATASFDSYRRIPIHTVCGKVKMEFEGFLFDAMAGYDEYLTCIYGDYMKLPPKEKQISNHSFMAYKK